MLYRNITLEAEQTAREFKIVCVTGPRQSGKTTLCKMVFNQKPYVNLENPDIALEAMEQPRTFLKKYPKGAILDEVQRVPHLFNYLQEIVDNRNKNDQFILSGSNNFLMQENISQSLAGRVGYIELLPFSLNELKKNRKNISDLQKMIFNGFYPSVITGKSSAERWIDNYIRTYIERDVRQLKNIDNLLVFEKFLRIIAGRVGQMINLSAISVETGVDAKTIESWLGVLESSYIIFRLPPYHPNFNKRVIKTTKLYFYDTGVLCYLLGIKSKTALKRNDKYGFIFENFVIAEIKKNRYNREQTGKMYFLRDSVGNEVDLVLEKDGNLIPVEIKSTEKINSDHVKNIKWFNRTFRQTGGIIIYCGKEKREWDQEIVQLNWKAILDL
jgi:predicted AAA+ superfamily ATPase